MATFLVTTFRIKIGNCDAVELSVYFDFFHKLWAWSLIRVLLVERKTKLEGNILQKEHTSTFECEICNYKAPSHEVIEVHLFTFEIYKCYKCDYTETGNSETHIRQQGSGDQNNLHII